MRQLSQQTFALAQRFAYQPEFAVLQVPQPAVDNTRGAAGGAAREVVLLNQQDALAPASALTRDCDAVDAAANDQNVKDLVAMLDGATHLTLIRCLFRESTTLLESISWQEGKLLDWDGLYAHDSPSERICPQPRKQVLRVRAGPTLGFDIGKDRVAPLDCLQFFDLFRRYLVRGFKAAPAIEQRAELLQMCVEALLRIVTRVPGGDQELPVGRFQQQKLAAYLFGQSRGHFMPTPQRSEER